LISVERLSALPLFAHLPVEARRRLAEQFEEHVCTDHEIVFSEGDVSDTLWFVAEGAVVIQKDLLMEKGNKVLSVLGPGDFFGENALLDKTPRLATAVAQGPTVLLSLSAKNIQVGLTGDLQIPLRYCLPVLSTLNARLRHVTLEMMILFDVGGLLAQNLDPAPLVSGLASFVVRAFDDSVVALAFLWDEFSATYQPVRINGGLVHSDETKNFKDPVFHWMAERGECLVSLDWPKDERFSSDDRLLWPSFQSFLATPILGTSCPVAFLVFGHPEKKNYFTPNHRRVLAGVANLVAPAFDSAYSRLENRARERLNRARNTGAFIV